MRSSAIESKWFWLPKHLMGSRQPEAALIITNRPHLVADGYIAEIRTHTMTRFTRELHIAGAVVGNRVKIVVAPQALNISPKSFSNFYVHK